MSQIVADPSLVSVFPPLPNDTFDIIYADPPWDYKGQRQHAGRGNGDTGGAACHYPTVTLALLRQLAVPKIAAENCLLFMWSTSPHLDQAIELGKSWGFSWATVGFVWDKQSTNPGYYTLSQCELCLVFKKGRIPQPRGARDVRQLVSTKRSHHSSKPDEVRCGIDEMFPTQRKIELFARPRHHASLEFTDFSENPSTNLPLFAFENSNPCQSWTSNPLQSWTFWGLEANGAQ